MQCYCDRRRARALAAIAAPLAMMLCALAATGASLDLERALVQSQAAVGRQLGDYAFTDRDGSRVRLADYRGKPLLVSFVYTGCSQVCPTTTRFLGRAVTEARRALGPDAFNVATIGFNLPFDSAAAMKAFAKQQGIDQSRWKFLSPDAASVDALAADFGFVYNATASGFDHITQVTIVDANGRVFRQVYGESFELPMLIGPLRELVTGAPSPVQNVSELLDRVRILCTVYDPVSGRYRLNYGLFIEIFAGLSVLGSIFWYLSTEWRRQRRALRNLKARHAA
ncbi:MAG TPA: SCO family protein [Casimicrobiaceae bacterium]